MRVMQLIDSIRPGGAERMAVNLANTLVDRIDKSFLCCSRLEGELRNEIKPQVNYFFLNRKNVLDIKTYLRLKQYIKENRIQIIHAHGTSFFLASVLLLTGCSFKLIWHEHLGNRVNKSFWNNPVLFLCSRLFDETIVVNNDISNWVKKNLIIKNVRVLPNFIVSPTFLNYDDLEIDENNFNIICVSNFRVPKNHLNLLKAFKIISDKYFNAFLILIGKDYFDKYSSYMNEFIISNGLGEKIRMVTNEINVSKWLWQADLAVLSSDSEGSPLVLLEYGLAKLPVISTDVGDCKALIGDNGIIVPPGDANALANAIEEYYLDLEKSKLDGNDLYDVIMENHIAENAISFYLEVYLKTIKPE